MAWDRLDHLEETRRERTGGEELFQIIKGIETTCPTMAKPAELGRQLDGEDGTPHGMET